MLIDSNDKLEEFFQDFQANLPQFIAVDTEFMRSNKLYYPKICLMQIAYNDKQVVIDLLSENLNLSLIQTILVDNSIVKVFHDCRQDLESLLTIFSEVPNPIFDTQIAAMFCNYYDNLVSYARLVEQLLGVQLDKISFKKTDWVKRPLSADKIQYALDDVIYLRDIYKLLLDKLTLSNKLSYFLEEMSSIQSMKFNVDLNVMLSKLNLPPELSSEGVTIAYSLLEWRELTAQALNINRDRIFANQNVYAITQEILNQHPRILPSRYAKKSGSRCNFMKILNKNKEKQITIPMVSDDYLYNKSILNMLLILLYNKCYSYDISQRLVTCQNDLIKFILGKNNNLLSGWRYDFFGKYVDDFMQGKLKILASAEKLDNGKIDIKTNLVRD